MECTFRHRIGLKFAVTCIGCKSRGHRLTGTGEVRSYVHRVQEAAAAEGAADRVPAKVAVTCIGRKKPRAPLTGTGEVRRYMHRVQEAAAAADRVPAKFAVRCTGCKKPRPPRAPLTGYRPRSQLGAWGAKRDEGAVSAHRMG